ncbi:MAG: hypothetical protein UT33_C0007G0097 [Candidatus Peregrinibacteria bacterium GW2011_GWC2_39_14]|nr:MAG: hypothetical protein US92_C0002G0099 [Candidatus Peregrinibacteria bacterium GW2011_GWA2_38_36]KKR06909.1 MAG: hypothetical protein UT33_C0007G0097 [Candidatus Peregrinibacteria bacterium GW2011_GWC2_39_14]
MNRHQKPDDREFERDENTGLWLAGGKPNSGRIVFRDHKGNIVLPDGTTAPDELIHVPKSQQPALDAVTHETLSRIDFANVLKGEAAMPDLHTIRPITPANLKPNKATQDLLHKTVLAALDKFTSGTNKADAQKLFERCSGVQGDNPFQRNEREGLNPFSIENESAFIEFIQTLLNLLSSKAARSARESVLKMLFHLQSFAKGIDWKPLIPDFIKHLDTDDFETAFFFEHILKINFKSIAQEQAEVILKTLQSQHRLSGDLAQILLNRFPELQNAYHAEISYANRSLADIAENVTTLSEEAMNETNVIGAQVNLATASNRKVTLKSIQEIEGMPKKWRNKIWDMKTFTFRDESKEAMLERVKTLLANAPGIDKNESKIMTRHITTLWHHSISGMGLEIEMKLQGSNQNRDPNSSVQSNIINRYEEAELGVDIDAGVAELRSGIEGGIPVNKEHCTNLLYLNAELEGCHDLVNIASNHHHVTVSSKMMDEGYIEQFYGLGHKKTVFAFKYMNHQGAGGSFTLESKSSPLAVGTSRDLAGEVPYFFETARYLDQFFLLESLKAFAVDDFDMSDFLNTTDSTFLEQLKQNPQACLSLLYEQTGQQNLLLRVYLYCARQAKREDLIPLILRLRKDDLLPDTSHELRIALWRQLKKRDQTDEKSSKAKAKPMPLDPKDIIASIKELDKSDGLVWFDHIRIMERFGARVEFSDVKSTLMNKSESIFVKLLLIEIMQRIDCEEDPEGFKAFILSEDVPPLVRGKIIDKTIWYGDEGIKGILAENPDLPYQVRIGLAVKATNYSPRVDSLTQYIDPTKIEEIQYLLKIRSSDDPRGSISNGHYRIIENIFGKMHDLSFEDFFPMITDTKMKHDFKTKIIGKLSPLSEAQRNRLHAYIESLPQTYGKYEMSEALKKVKTT